MRIQPGKIPECIDFSVVGLNKTVSHGSCCGNIEDFAGKYIACGRYPCDIKCPWSLDTYIVAVHPSDSEVNNRYASSRTDHSGSLGCHQGLKMYLIENIGFQKLSFPDRSNYFQQRLIGKNRSAFWQCINITCKSKILEPLQKIFIKFS